MNKSKQPIAKNHNKKMQKEIRVAQSAYPVKEELPRTDKLSAKDALKKYPPKVVKAEAAVIESTQKNMEVKKKKLHANPSKRTTPGEVHGRESAPSNAHNEGTRWIKTLEKQAVIQSKTVRRKTDRIPTAHLKKR